MFLLNTGAMPLSFFSILAFRVNMIRQCSMILKKIVVQGDVTTPVDIAPHTNNLKRNGQFIGANMRMLEEFDLENIIPESFKLFIVKDTELFIVKDTGELTEEWIPAQRVMVDMFNDGLNVKFSNQAVLDFNHSKRSRIPCNRQISGAVATPRRRHII